MRTVHGLLVLLLVAGFSAQESRAQSYPTKPVHIFTSGGGGSDFTARLIATELSPPLGQPVVVENRAAGAILGSAVAKAAPDGYTLLVWGGGLWLGSLFEEVPYDPVRDFAPIATVSRSPYVFVVHPSVPATTVADMVKLAKAKPGQLNYTSGATGGATHIAGELFKSMANVDIVRIAYKNQAQESTDLLSGQVQMTFGSGAALAALAKAGKLRALATAGTKRSALFPDLPTISETLPGYVSESMLAVFAPAKTPQPIISRLNQETLRVLDKPDVREKLLNNGQEPVGGTPEQLADAVKSEMARVSKLIKDGAIKLGT